MAQTMNPRRLKTPLHKAPRSAAAKLTAMALAGVALLALSACSAPYNTVASPSAAMSSPVYPAPAEALGTDPKKGATCGVLSAIETNLNNALQEHKAGTLSDTSYAMIIDTVTPDLQVVGGVPDYGLQGDPKNLNSAIKKSPATLAGADFDPETTTFGDATERLAQDCVANHTPISISSTTG